jgi:hypothetical protein
MDSDIVCLDSSDSASEQPPCKRDVRYYRRPVRAISGPSRQANHAERYMAFVQAFDLVRQTLTHGNIYEGVRSQDRRVHPPPVEGEEYLVTFLKACLTVGGRESRLRVVMLPTRSGAQHQCLGYHAGTGVYSSKDGDLIQKSLRKVKLGAVLRKRCDIDRGLIGEWASGDFTRSWIAAYLAGVHPNVDQPLWQYFQCSHRCIESGLSTQGLICIDAGCMIWESQRANLARGQTMSVACTERCPHTCCDKTICACTGIHGDAACL